MKNHDRDSLSADILEVAHIILAGLFGFLLAAAIVGLPLWAVFELYHYLLNK